MRLTRARVFLAASLLAASGTVAGAVAAAAPASAGSSPVVLVNCAGHGQVKPAGYDIGCMPSSEFITGLHWNSWASVAFGSGVLMVNDCKPTCAQGRYVAFPLLVVLWRAEPWPGHSGRSYFSRLTWIFSGVRPAHNGTSQTFTLPAS